MQRATWKELDSYKDVGTATQVLSQLTPQDLLEFRQSAIKSSRLKYLTTQGGQAAGALNFSAIVYKRMKTHPFNEEFKTDRKLHDLARGI